MKGWVRTKRGQKTFTFLEVNDGSCLKGLQVVVDAELPSYGELDRVTTGASVSIRGSIAPSPGKNQKYELKAAEVTVLGECPTDYPFQKKKHSLEFLRSAAHLRPRTNTIASVASVRSALAFATHEVSIHLRTLCVGCTESSLGEVSSAPWVCDLRSLLS